MVTLPNGVTVFNGLHRPVHFYGDGWNQIVKVDRVINVKKTVKASRDIGEGGQLATVECLPTNQGYQIIDQAIKDGADVIVGSVLAAMAYPGFVAVTIPLRKKGSRADYFEFVGVVQQLTREERLAAAALPSVGRVMKAVDEAVYQTRRLSEDRWAGWVAYMIERLDEVADPDGDFLTAVKEAIEARLEEGSW